MDLIDGLVLAQVQSSHQQHDVQPIGETWQRQCISRRTAVGPLMSGTLRVRAAIARMNQSDHLLQGDHRPPRERHRLSQRPMTFWTLMLGGSIPAPHYHWIRSASFHQPAPCFYRTPFSFASILPHWFRRILCPDGKKTASLASLTRENAGDAWCRTATVA